MVDVNKKELEAILISILAAIKSMALYPSEHPQVKAPLEKGFASLADLLRIHGTLTLGVVDEVLVFEGVPFYSSHVAIKDIQHRLEQRQINAVEIHDGLIIEEYTDFVRLLADDHQAFLEQGGLNAALREKQITHIQSKDVKEVYNTAIDAISDVLGQTRMGKIPRADKAKHAVADLKRFILADRPAIIALTMIKSYDSYLFNHSVNVSVLALALAQALDVPEDDLADVGLAGLLHDIGKTHTPKNIILKPSTLNDEEWALMKQHPEKGAEIITQMEDVSELVVRMVREHHVNYNLCGYPELEPGERPHPYSKIITVADCYDAITTLRPYQKPFHPREAMRIMENLAGKVIDPKYFEEFVKVLGIYPIGTLVRLDTNEVALVLETYAQAPLKPRIKILYDPEGKLLPHAIELDLFQDQSPEGEARNIVSTVDPILFNIDPQVIQT